MAAEPKKRHSRQRQGKRRHSISLAASAQTKCPQCGSIILPHVVCPNCGFYKGKEVISKKPAKQA